MGDYEHVEGELLFNNEENSKTIEIAISEEDSYEKNVVMYVVIGEPRHIAGPPGEGEGVDYAALDAKGEENWTEDERINFLKLSLSKLAMMMKKKKRVRKEPK